MLPTKKYILLFIVLAANADQPIRDLPANKARPVTRNASHASHNFITVINIQRHGKKVYTQVF
jgi:hypothetical protein